MGLLDSRAVVLGTRIAQAILAIIVLGLTGYVVSWWGGYYHSGSPSQIAFLLFCAVWTIVSLIFLIVVPFRFSETGANHKFAILGVEALTMLFWFAGFIALAVFLSDRVCYGHVCSAAKAAAAFGAFEWLVFALSTAMAVMHVLSNRSSGSKANPNLNMQGV